MQTPDTTDTETTDLELQAETEELPKLLGRTVELQVPVSVAEALDVLGLPHQGVSPNRIVACALGLCYRRLRTYMQRDGIRYAGNPAIYGGQVLDYLIEKGAEFHVIARLGREALELIQRESAIGGIPRSKAEGEELLGNSGSDTGGSPSTS